MTHPARLFCPIMSPLSSIQYDVAIETPNGLMLPLAYCPKSWSIDVVLPYGIALSVCWQ